MPIDILRLVGQVEIKAAAGGDKIPRVSILAYAGGAMQVTGWGPVAIDLSGLDLPPQIPVLVDHDPALGNVAGFGKPTIENGQLLVEGKLPPITEAARQVVELSKAGFQFQASVGVEPRKRDYLKSGESATINGRKITAGADGIAVIRAGALREISIVALGADNQTSVSVAAKARREKSMSNEPNATNPNANPAVPDYMVAAWDQAGMTDAERVKARWGALALADNHLRGEAQDLLLQAGIGGLPFRDFDLALTKIELRDAKLRALRAERPPAPPIYGSSHDAAGALTGENLLAAASLVYFGRESLAEKTFGATAVQRARDLKIRSIFDLARFALHDKGVEAAPYSGEALLKAAFSTTGLPIALGDSAGKIARAAYDEQPATWRSWCAVVPVSDFKTKKLLRVGHTAGLEQVGPGGEIKHTSLMETSAEVTAATFARMISIPRQLLVNDDLGLIPQVASDFGRLAMRKVANLVYTSLMTNANNFFAETALNLIDNPLSAPGLSAALKVFRSQVDSDGEPIDIRPAVLLVPPSLESTARQLLASEQLQRYVADGTDQRPTGNPFANLGLTLEVEPRLENSAYVNASATAWYLMAGPGAQVAVVAFLNGQLGPVVESADSDFDTLGRQWRCFIDVGVGLCDRKGGVLSTGDAE